MKLYALYEIIQVISFLIESNTRNLYVQEEVSRFETCLSFEDL